ncbi:hypothetical protein V6M85_11755 [Sulfolobus tengchongensis]|uniref:Uncharacterized protein n=1 Tax=Sulfolobus tengchongensis TaxID=207809 RepID=A0AAX4KYZ9_9CREN
MLEITDYQVIESQEGVYEIKTEKENLIVKIIPVVVKMYKEDDKLGIVINNVIVATTDKPSFGPLCNPSMLSSRSANIIEIKEIRRPSGRIKIQDKEINVQIMVTNISVYDGYRDNFGSLCVVVSTVTVY